MAKWASRTATLALEKGFTIVELLIVVVVIAILAAITIVSYNGITARATQSQILTEARQASSLLRAYHAQYGQYPPITNGQPSVCIGEGFTHYVGTTQGDCWDTRSSIARSVDPGFNTELAKIGSLTSNNKPTIFYRTGPDVYFTGPVFSTPAETSVALSYHAVRYWISGSVCPLGTRVWLGTLTETSQCAINLEQ